jgi:DNA primase
MYGDINYVKHREINKVDDVVIYSHFLKEEVSIGTKILSPFTDEKTPSFSFFRNGNKVLFKCFSTGIGGGTVSFVSALLDIPYDEAVRVIYSEIYCNTRYNVDLIKKKQTNYQKQEAKIEVVLKDFTSQGLEYWKSFGISVETLEKYDVKQCLEVWLNDKIWHNKNDKELCFRYRIGSKYKIYKPTTEVKKKKWVSNTKLDNIQGFKELDYSKNDLLIITSSLKDVMILNEVLGINAIAFSSESQIIKQSAVEYFNNKFKRVLIFYDSDKQGISYAKKQSLETGWDYIYIPELYDSKDPSDLYKEVGVYEFKKTINQLLN